MKIVSRVRLSFISVVLAGHIASLFLFPDGNADVIIVLLAINATLVFVVAPFLADRMFMGDLRVVDTFINEVKKGNFDIILPVHNQALDEEDTGEFTGLRRSLNWMARQIQIREERIKTEIERVRKLNGELEKQSVTDPLTGLFNQGYFWTRISASFSAFLREGRPFSLVIADIDFFKKVNDTYGHPSGDLVLKGVASILKAQIRDTDVLARIGGEEFGIILNGPSSDDAPALLNRLQKRMRETAFPLDDGTRLQVTISMGFVTVSGGKTASAEEVVKRADDALYFVKQNGRDGFVNWTQIPAR